VLNGRRIVVTGASSGIGRGLARAFSSAGARVWGVGRDPGALEETARDHPGMLAVSADLTTASGRNAVATAIDHRGGRLDVIVHAAGLLGAPGVTLDAYPEPEWRDVIDINLTAVHLLHQELIAALERGTVPTVIALASTVGRIPRQGWGAYAVSKAAEAQLARNLAVEWGRKGIRVNAIAPGVIETDFARALWENPKARRLIEGSNCIGRLGRPEDVAGLAVFLASDAAAFITGQTILVDGGSTIFTPLG